jgi:cytoskeletal protein CcmA (bactofilin family)
MGLFNTTTKESESSSMSSQQSPAQDQINLVGKGTVFEGTVRAESDVRASGQIIGTLRVEGKAMISESGSVDGEIIATNADIAGRVQGEIEVEERLVLKETAQVDGNITTDRLVVEEGAEFTGECRMGTPVAVNGESGDEALEEASDADEEQAAEDDQGDQPDEAPSPQQAAG